MGRALFSIISLIALAVLIVLNIDARATFNLFGWQFEEVAVPVLAIVSFVLGAFYTFLFYIFGYFSRTRKRKLERQKQKLKTQEQSVREENQRLRREKKGQAKQSPAGSAPAARPALTGPTAGTPAANVTPPADPAADENKKSGTSSSKRGLKRFFGASSK